MLENSQSEKNEFEKELYGNDNVKDNSSATGLDKIQPELLPTTPKTFSSSNYDTLTCDSFCFSLWKLGDDEIRLQGNKIIYYNFVNNKINSVIITKFDI